MPISIKFSAIIRLDNYYPREVPELWTERVHQAFAKWASVYILKSRNDNIQLYKVNTDDAKHLSRPSLGIRRKVFDYLQSRYRRGHVADANALVPIMRANEMTYDIHNEFYWLKYETKCVRNRMVTMTSSSENDEDPPVSLFPILTNYMVETVNRIKVAAEHVSRKYSSFSCSHPILILNCWRLLYRKFLDEKISRSQSIRFRWLRINRLTL